MAVTGRPLKYKTVDEITPLIDKFFKETKIEDLTITGLAMALDTCRRTLIDYEGRDEFCNTIKRAKQRVENSYEIDLKKKGNTGTIFALKNFDWKDKTEVDNTTKNIIYTKEDWENMSDEELLKISDNK